MSVFRADFSDRRQTCQPRPLTITDVRGCTNVGCASCIRWYLVAEPGGRRVSPLASCVARLMWLVALRRDSTSGIATPSGKGAADAKNTHRDGSKSTDTQDSLRGVGGRAGTTRPVTTTSCLARCICSKSRNSCNSASEAATRRKDVGWALYLASDPSDL
jgi:hypothetical protein